MLMKLDGPELTSVLRKYNPWWRGGRFPDLPQWHRAAFQEIIKWLGAPPGGRALLLIGARQIGKTTLYLQSIHDLLDKGIPPQNILYATFDHALLKLAGMDEVIRIWREAETRAEGPEYLFLDEVQSLPDWQIWVKHQVDFDKHRRIAITGSATPLVTQGQESGVGRWYTLRLATLSFFEYLQIKKLALPELPQVTSLSQLFNWPSNRFQRIGSVAHPMIALFHEYLLRGGFPQCALMDSIPLLQKMLREDIVDKVLKRDMTALFGVRRVVELEQTFLYLCLHDGGLLNIQDLCKNLQLKKPTVQNFINLLEATNLIYRLFPFGYGKEILRGRSKVYLADASISPAALLRGKSLLEDETALGRAVETTFFKHVFTRYYRQSIAFSFWKGARDVEIDIVAEVEGDVIPFEVKYRSQAVAAGALKGLKGFCKEKNIKRCYVVTRNIDDFGPDLVDEFAPTKLMKIPASLACFWLGQAEVMLGKDDRESGGGK